MAQNKILLTLGRTLLLEGFLKIDLFKNMINKIKKYIAAFSDVPIY